LALDAGRFSELDSSVRQYLAWTSIIDDVIEKRIDLDNSNKATAEASRTRTNSDVGVKLGEVTAYALVPYQHEPRGILQWESIKVAGDITQLTVRLIKKLEAEQHITRTLGANVLRTDVDRVPLWRDDKHVSVAQLQDDFAKYVYLPRLLNESALVDAIVKGANPLDLDSGFAYADNYDPETQSYERLRFAMFDGGRVPTGWLVKPGVAQPIIDALLAKPEPTIEVNVPANTNTGGRTGFDNFWGSGNVEKGATPPNPTTGSKKRFHGSITLQHDDFREKAGEVSREIAAQLAKVVGSKVTIMVEVIAEAQSGYSEDVLRAVSENCRTLKFDSFEFEED
jgi:hypothetical protein